MLNEILNAVLDSLVMVSSFGIFMLFCAFSNSILGSVIASKTNEFQWKTLLTGVVRNIGVVLGVDILAAGLSGITKLIEIYNVAPQYSESIQGVSVLAIVAIIITLSYTVYGKQALDKIKSLGNLKDEDIVVIDKAEGWEQRGP